MDSWIERKIKPRLWKFKYKEVLNRKPKQMKGRIKGVQRAIKTNTNTYRLVLKGRRYNVRRKRY